MFLSNLMEKLGSRNLITDPSYRKVDKIGRVTIGKEFAGKEVIVIALEPKLPNDKADYIKL
ncbi:MAG: hypothetical protein WB392_08010 [Methanotrichaceae archaeon]